MDEVCMYDMLDEVCMCVMIFQCVGGECVCV